MPAPAPAAPGAAAARPARVRSLMSARSNSARAPNRCKMSWPPAVVVSIRSWRLRNPMARRRRPSTVRMRSARDRPRRTSRQTTRTSPGWAVELAPARDSRGPYLATGRRIRSPGDAEPARGSGLRHRRGPGPGPGSPSERGIPRVPATVGHAQRPRCEDANGPRPPLGPHVAHDARLSGDPAPSLCVRVHAETRVLAERGREVLREAAPPMAPPSPGRLRRSNGHPVPAVLGPTEPASCAVPVARDRRGLRTSRPPRHFGITRLGDAHDRVGRLQG
jgi:hypothetical protein